MNIPFEARVAQKLYERLHEHLQTAHRELGNGSQIVHDDAGATGMKCAKYIGRIEGLSYAVAALTEVEKEMNGKAPVKGAKD